MDFAWLGLAWFLFSYPMGLYTNIQYPLVWLVDEKSRG